MSLLEQLKKELDYLNASIKSRSSFSELILNHPEYIPALVKIGVENSTPYSPRAFWVLEFMSKKNLVLLLPELQILLDYGPQISIDSSKRPLSKIIESICTQYFKKKNPIYIETITEKQLEQMTQLCFDWLIGEEKVAVKAFSMQSLYYLGTHFNWIHRELRPILENNLYLHSPAYTSRAKKVLAAMQKEV